MLLPTLLTETDLCSYMTKSAELKVSHNNLAVSPATEPEHRLWARARALRPKAKGPGGMRDPQVSQRMSLFHAQFLP